MTTAVNLLANWRVLNDHLYSLKEGEVQALLDTELAGARRASILLRLHQRFCTLRNNRERKDILAKAETV